MVGGPKAGLISQDGERPGLSGVRGGPLGCVQLDTIYRPQTGGVPTGHGPQVRQGARGPQGPRKRDGGKPGAEGTDAEIPPRHLSLGEWGSRQEQDQSPSGQSCFLLRKKM